MRSARGRAPLILISRMHSSSKSMVPLPSSLYAFERAKCWFATFNGIKKGKVIQFQIFHIECKDLNVFEVKVRKSKIETLYSASMITPSGYGTLLNLLANWGCKSWLVHIIKLVFRTNNSGDQPGKMIAKSVGINLCQHVLELGPSYESTDTKK